MSTRPKYSVVPPSFASENKHHSIQVPGCKDKLLHQLGQVKKSLETKPQPSRLYACSKAAAGIFEGCPLPEKPSFAHLSECMHAPSVTERSAAGDAHRLHLPLPAALRCFPGDSLLSGTRARQQGSLARRWRGRNGVKKEGEEKMETQIRVHLWKLEGAEKPWLGLQIRSESWKWEKWRRNGLVKKLELAEEGTWVWGLGGGSCCLKDKRKSYWRHSE